MTAVGLSADGSLAISCGNDKTVCLWEIASTRCLFTSPKDAYTVASVTLSADGKQALSGSDDGVMRLWKLDLPV